MKDVCVLTEEEGEGLAKSELWTEKVLCGLYYFISAKCHEKGSNIPVVLRTSLMNALVGLQNGWMTPLALRRVDCVTHEAAALQRS